MTIGSLCSLAQQSLLCIKHLRTEVLNNIFTFPVDMGSACGDNSLLLVPLSNSDVLSLSQVTRMLLTRSLESHWCRGDERLPSFWHLPVGSLLSPVSSLCRSGMDNWSEHRPLTERWPDREPRGRASQLQRDQMGRWTKIVTYPPPSWKYRRPAPEGHEGLIWSKKPHSEPEVEL